MPGATRVIALILLYVWSSYSVAAAPLRVLTSIKPLQLLAVAVGGGRVDVQVLLDPRGSPHDYQLRPSDRTRLDGAEIVFWVGPRLEQFLQPALKVASSRVTAVALDDGAADPHLWIDPIAMQATAQHIAEAYAKLRPADADFFYANAARVSSELAREDQRLRGLLAGAGTPRGFIVEHDAYQRIESRYGLAHLAAITDSSDLPPSVSAMLRIRGLLDSGKAGCILAEAQESTQLRSLLDGRSVRVVRLDPMAVSVQVGPTGLLDFYRQLGEAIATCVAR
jgi:zinc transport system substrate-binding protein